MSGPSMWSRCRGRVALAALDVAGLTRSAVRLAVAIALLESVATAQPAPSGPPLQLVDVQAAAAAADPRMRQLTLLASQSSLRLENVSTQWKPAVAVESLAQYQSDAPTSLLLAPGGTPAFFVPRENYDLYARVEQRLFDSSVAAQAATERAQLLEQQARVRTALYTLRQQVNVHKLGSSTSLGQVTLTNGAGGFHPPTDFTPGTYRYDAC